MKIVEKPWGHEVWWAVTEKYVGKVLHIKKGHKLSLQHHNIKDETVRVSHGELLLQLADEHGVLQDHTLFPGEAMRIPTGRMHRMVAISDCDVYEVSTPEVDDIVRHEDSYGRIAG